MNIISLIILVSLGIGILIEIVMPVVYPVLNAFSDLMLYITNNYLDGTFAFFNEVSKTIARYSEISFILFLLVFGIIVGVFWKR